MTQPTAPVRIEIIPDQLWARVHVHDIGSQHGPIACWSYVSDGLARHHHPEIVFTLRRLPGEPVDGFPKDPLRLFATIYPLAEAGQRIAAGGFTEFGAKRFYDHHLLYAAAQPMAGCELPSPCLAALLITDDELRAVRTFGCARVLARMGEASSHYPYPPWSDRRRPGLVLDRTFEASVVSKLPRIAAYDVHVGGIDNQLMVSALRSQDPPWRDRLAALPDGSPFALLTSIDPAANGCLTWVPGQTEPTAIVPPGSDGSRLCGCFVAVIPDQPETSGKMLEDGFAMALTGDTWRTLRAALIDGTELVVPATGDGMSFALAWRDAVYVSPVDGVSDVAEGGWHTYVPNAPAAGIAGKVTLGKVRLLMPELEVATRTSPEDLAVFCHEIERCAERVLDGLPGPLEIALRVTCRPRDHRVELAPNAAVSEDTRDALLEALEQIPRLPVRREVAFEAALIVSAGDV